MVGNTRLGRVPYLPLPDKQVLGNWKFSKSPSGNGTGQVLINGSYRQLGIGRIMATRPPQPFNLPLCSPLASFCAGCVALDHGGVVPESTKLVIEL